MVNVTLTELDLNEIGAALIERSLRLSYELGRLHQDPPSESRDFALACNRQAIEANIRVRLILSAAIEEPELPEDMTFVQMFEGIELAPGEYVEAFGK